MEKNEVYKMDGLESKEITKVLNILIGDTKPVGDTWADEKRFDNLIKLCYVTDWCLNRIAIASESFNRPEASVQTIGTTAKKYLTDTKTWVEEHLSELDISQ